MINFEQIQAEKQEQYNRVKEANLLHVPVLDKGFVKLIDWMGTDKDITRSARISYGKHNEQKTDEQDKKLIDYLIENSHTSPFEQCQIRLTVKMPIFVARQWIRHRTWSVNEVSGRYTELSNDFYIPTENNIKGQGLLNKQGSDGELPETTVHSFLSRMIDNCRCVFKDYKEALLSGISKERARISLPLSTYTEMVFCVDLLNLLKFLSLRDSPHAQWEIREYAGVLNDIVKCLYPSVYESYVNHWKEKMVLSGEEIKALRDILSQYPDLSEKLQEKENVSRGWNKKIQRLIEVFKKG